MVHFHIFWNLNECFQDILSFRSAWYVARTTMLSFLIRCHMSMPKTPFQLLFAIFLDHQGFGFKQKSIMVLGSRGSWLIMLRANEGSTPDHQRSWLIKAWPLRAQSHQGAESHSSRAQAHAHQGSRPWAHGLSSSRLLNRHGSSQHNSWLKACRAHG